MANTDNLLIRRPTVGAPYDKNASGFDPATHVDVLDEIDVSSIFMARYIEWVSIAPYKEYTPPSGVSTSYKPHSATDKDEASIVFGGSTNVWIVGDSAVQDTGIAPILMANYDASGMKYFVSDGDVVKRKGSSSWDVVLDDSSSDNYNPFERFAYMYAWGTPTLILTDGTNVITSTDHFDTYTDAGPKFSGSSGARYEVFGGNYLVRVTGTTLEVLDESLTVTNKTAPSPFAYIDQIASDGTHFYLFGRNSDSSLFVFASSTDLDNWKVVTTTALGGNPARYVYLGDVFMVIDFEYTSFSPPERGLYFVMKPHLGNKAIIIPAAHVFGDPAIQDRMPPGKRPSIEITKYNLFYNFDTGKFYRQVLPNVELTTVA